MLELVVRTLHAHKAPPLLFEALDNPAGVRKHLDAPNCDWEILGPAQGCQLKAGFFDAQANRALASSINDRRNSLFLC
jgi:hypothetical protein